jgi:predicted flap endonuclease-1-like 5' DNA nuclease
VLVPYTLTMGALWFALAFVLGLAIGFAVRSVAARRQVVAARQARAGPAMAAPVTPDDPRIDARVRAADLELDRLRARIAELEARTTPRIPTATRGPGHDIEVDDLTVVAGLGPGVRDLCHGIGIRTWSDLAATEPSLLRTMLDDAGARYQVHDPSTWPDQAQLLAEGRWDEFRELAASIRPESAARPDPS